MQMSSRVLIASLQQGRGIFNPFPLEDCQDVAFMTQVVSIANQTYQKLLLANGHIGNEENHLEEKEKAKLENLLSKLNHCGRQGLWWNEELKEKTCNYWDERIKASKFQVI